MRAFAAATVLTVAALLPLQPASAAPVDIKGEDPGGISCGFCWDTGLKPR